MAKDKKQHQTPVKADLDFDLDIELDFDLDDFDVLEDLDSHPQGRILKPRIDPDSIAKMVTFKNAEEFAEQIDLVPGARTFAWVDGSFIFGDIIEALWNARNVQVKNVYISTLSMSQDNIDSLYNLLTFAPVEHLYMAVSGYFYSHEKYNLVPYMYEKLDIGDKTQVAFGNFHGKIIALETALGHTITIHGSANLRSSSSIEQIMVEVDNQPLFDFNAGIIKSLCDKYGTINHGVTKPKAIRGEKSWQAVARGH